MSIVVIATIHPLAEFRSEIVSLFEQTIARVHAEDGCELYAMHEDPDTIVMIEKWSGAEQLEAHRAGETSRFGPALEGKLAGKTVVKVYTPHPAGTAGQGAL